MRASRLADDRLTLVGLLVEAHDEVLARLNAVHARFGLSGSDADALLRLARSPGRELRMTDLALETGLSTSGVTRVVDRLEARGMVSRQGNAADRRSQVAHLTEDGLAVVLDELTPLLAAIDDALMTPLGETRARRFASDLRRVRDANRAARSG